MSIGNGLGKDCGLNRRRMHSKGCKEQLRNGINQLNSIEKFIPHLSSEFGFAYNDLKIQKVIITFEQLVAQNQGPLRNWMGIEQGNKLDCKIIWVWYFEEIQPYIARGASLWSFLTDFPGIEFNEIISEMKSKTGTSYSDSVLCSYEDKLFNELIRDAECYQDL